MNDSSTELSWLEGLEKYMHSISKSPVQLNVH